MTRVNSYRPIPVLELITDLIFGGAQIGLQHFLEHIDRSIFAPQVAVLHNGQTPIASQIRSLGIPVVDLKMDPKIRLDRIYSLYRLIKQERFAIVHNWLFHANIMGRLTGSCAKVPVIISSRHNVDIGGNLRELINRMTAPLDDHSIAVCQYVRSIELARARIPANKVTTIYNGVALDLFQHPDHIRTHQIKQELGITDDALIIGCIGRLHPQKGYPQLLQALKDVKDKIPGVHLLIIGTGELDSQLKSMAHKLGLSKSVTFAGSRTDIPAILNCLDLFVLPSLWEGHPLVVLEAMAAGLPVVATQVGGTPEVVQNGETGLLVEPKDISQLASAMITLLQNPSLRKEMGIAGKKRVRLFSIENMTQKTESLYMKLYDQKISSASSPSK